MNWFERLNPIRIKTNTSNKRVPEGLWSKCDACNAVLYQQELEKNLNVCPKCHHHMRLNARLRLQHFLDPDHSVELGINIEPIDSLNFKDTKRYRDRLVAAQKATNEKDALVIMEGQLQGLPVVCGAFEFSFMGGSMGSVVGERFVIAANHALEKKIPLIVFSASGGARMQEALLSLMQMAKTSAVLAKLRDHGIPFISVLTDPTMGGVSASFAMLGDIHIAEPNALIGFAGPRVIEQTVREKLPEGFQRAEFLLQKGAIDLIVDRRQMRNEVASLIAKLTHQAVPPKEVFNDHDQPPETTPVIQPTTAADVELSVTSDTQ